MGTRLAATIETAKSGDIFEPAPEFKHKMKTIGDDLVKKFMRR